MALSSSFGWANWVAVACDRLNPADPPWTIGDSFLELCRQAI